MSVRYSMCVIYHYLLLVTLEPQVLDYPCIGRPTNKGQHGDVVEATIDHRTKRG